MLLIFVFLESPIRMTKASLQFRSFCTICFAFSGPIFPTSTANQGDLARSGLPSFHQSQDSLHYKGANPPPPPRTATLPPSFHKPTAPAPPPPVNRPRHPVARPPPPPSRPVPPHAPPPPPPTAAPPPPPHRTAPVKAPPPPVSVIYSYQFSALTVRILL